MAAVSIVLRGVAAVGPAVDAYIHLKLAASTLRSPPPPSARARCSASRPPPAGRLGTSRLHDTALHRSPGRRLCRIIAECICWAYENAFPALPNSVGITNSARRA